MYRLVIVHATSALAYCVLAAQSFVFHVPKLFDALNQVRIFDNVRGKDLVGVLRKCIKISEYDSGSERRAVTAAREGRESNG